LFEPAGIHNIDFSDEKFSLLMIFKSTSLNIVDERICLEFLWSDVHFSLCTNWNASTHGLFR